MFGSQCALQVNLFVTVLSNCLWLWSIESVHGQGSIEGVHIQLNGRIIKENGSVSITDIGVNDTAVLCRTDKEGCCANPWFGRAGEWYYPNNDRVENRGHSSNASFYRDRDQGVVRLNRRYDAMMPTGLFCCVIPDRNNAMQRLCIIIEVTPDDDGSGAGMLPDSTTTTAAPTITTTAESMNTVTTVAYTTTAVETVSTRMISPVTDASTTSTATDKTTIPPTTMTSPECDSIVLPLVPDGVGLYLDGNQLANYSMVNLADIGEGGCALICYTNARGCCKSQNIGEWYFPNGSDVRTNGAMDNFYRDREERMVRLNRRNNAMGPTGSYCCDIPGSNGDMTLCVGVYNSGDNLLLQLRLFEVQNCLEWVNVNANIKLNDISTVIISSINQHCLCGLSIGNVTNGVFRCFPASPQAVTFRAILHGGTKASSSELSLYIERWIRNDVTIPIQSVLINVDSRCMVVISSFDDGECQVNSEQHANNSSSAIIVGTVAGLLLLLILSSAMVILSLVILRKKHRGRDSKAQVQIPEANLTDSANHEYEVIDKYTKEYGDVVEMDLTKCPAYEPMRT